MEDVMSKKNKKTPEPKAPDALDLAIDKAVKTKATERKAANPEAKPEIKAKSEKKAKKVKIARFGHGVECKYAGSSVPINKSKSKTRLPIEDFSQRPDYVLTERSLDILKPLKAKYGKKEFARGDIDAGVLKTAGWRGVLAHVSGDPASETCMLKFTDTPM